MRYSFRLAELLDHVPDPRKRPGTIKAIVEYTGLDRHQVAALLKNEVKYIPLKALSRICDYLIEHGHASADQLPGALFAVEPENFWEVLARRRSLGLCMGVRRDVEVNNPEVSYIVASDSVLMGELLNGVTTLGGTAKHREITGHDGEGFNTVELSSPPHPETLRQSLVWSPGQASEAEVADRADQVYAEFSELSGDKALVCIGSTKSNPVVELLLARAFGCDPFSSQDSVKTATERSCPIFLRYRNDDPHPNSCVGGLQLSQSEPATEPGIYYELQDGGWGHCSLSKPNEDTAMVFYIHRESQGRLEMALGGFSGRATRLLARTLATRAEGFWPPVYNSQGIQVGAFIVQFTLSSGKDKSQDILRTDLVANTKIIPLSSEVIQRRIASQM